MASSSSSSSSSDGFNNSSDSNNLKLAINIYYVISEPYFLAFLIYFSYDYYRKFINPSVSNRDNNQFGNELAKKIGINKILIALFASGTWINEIAFSFYETQHSCYIGWKISSLLYVLAKANVYLFLYFRGEIVSVGEIKRTFFEKLIFLGTIGMPGIGIIAAVLCKGSYVNDTCSITVPIALAIVLILLDFGLSASYLLMFLLKLGKLAESLKSFSTSKTTSQKENRESEIQIADNSKKQDSSNNYNAIVVNEGSTAAEPLQSPKSQRSSIMTKPSTEINQHDVQYGLYRKLMIVHASVTGLTCSSTFTCMLLFVIYSATHSSTLQIVAGPIAGIDLFINITAIFYLTKGKSSS